MSRSCRQSVSRRFALVGTLLSFLSWALTLLAFILPYWVNIVEELRTPDMTESEVIYFQYTYGFWRYCHTITVSDRMIYNCGDITAHHDWEQTVVCLIMVGLLFQLNSFSNGFMHLVKFVEEKLCLHVAGLSSGIAGMVLLIAVILFGIQDQSIHASEPDVMEFKGAYFHFSFWGAVASCAFSFIVTGLHYAALFKYRHADIRFRRIQRQANIPVQPMPLMPDNGQHPYKTGKTQGLKDVPVFVMNEVRLVDSVRFRGPIYENQDEYFSNLKDLGCKILSSYDLLPTTRLETTRPNHEDLQNSNEHTQLTKSTMAFVTSEKYIEPFDTIRSKGATFDRSDEISTTLDTNGKEATILESFGAQSMPLDMFKTDFEGNDTTNPTSIQPWATFGSPAKRHLNGVSLEDQQRPQADCLLGDKCIATTFGNESACLESSRKRGASSRKGEASPRKGDGSSRKVDVSSSKREASSRKGDGSFWKGDASSREGESKQDFTNNEIIGSNIKTVVNPIDCMPLKTEHEADSSSSTGEDEESAKKQASSQAKGTNSTSFLRNEVELVPLACEGEKQDEVLYLSTTATTGHKENADGQTMSGVADCGISIYSTRHIRRGSDQHTRKVVPKENPKHLWRRAWTSFADKEHETEPSEL